MQHTRDFHAPNSINRDVEEGVQSFSIRELCESFAVTPRALRFYESQGLLTPERDGQRRIYSLRDRARLHLVLRGKRFGFSLAEIRDLLELYEVGDRQYTQLVATLNAAQEKLGELQERRTELDDAITELTSIIDAFEKTKEEMEADGAALAEDWDKRKKPILGRMPKKIKG